MPIRLFIPCLAAVLLMAGACSAPAEPAGLDPNPSRPDPVVERIEGPYDPVMIEGSAPLNGIFDPSVEYGPDGTGWMVYSAVFGGLVPFGPYVETRLARSLDNGAAWEYVKTINAAADEQISVPGSPTLDGNRNYEVSSLVYDPTDPGREWKLFSHRTFACPDCSELTQPQFSWISYRYASESEGPGGTWSAEEALMGSTHIPVAPFAGLPRINVNNLHSDLASYLVYTEPGTVAIEGTLYMSLTALTTSPQAIVLLASDDHGGTWRYVGTLLDNDDASGLGFDTFDGTSLVRVGTRNYLFASPKHGAEYSGTYIIEIVDIEDALVRRKVEGGLAPIVFIAPDADVWARGGHNAGESDYDEHNTAGGILFPQIDLGNLPSLFGFSNTGYVLAPDA